MVRVWLLAMLGALSGCASRHPVCGKTLAGASDECQETYRPRHIRGHDL